MATVRPTTFMVIRSSKFAIARSSLMSLLKSPTVREDREVPSYPVILGWAVGLIRLPVWILYAAISLNRLMLRSLERIGKARQMSTGQAFAQQMYFSNFWNSYQDDGSDSVALRIKTTHALV